MYPDNEDNKTAITITTEDDRFVVGIGIILLYKLLNQDSMLEFIDDNPIVKKALRNVNLLIKNEKI